MPGWRAIFAALEGDRIHADRDARPVSLGGGDISAAWRVMTNAGPLFLKTEDRDGFDRLDGEADGLRALREAGAVRVPEVRSCGVTGGDAFLALEWLELEPAGAETQRALGRKLAAQHRRTGESFGWHRDNTIGATPQVNTPDGDWLRFYGERRLRFQLDLAAHNGYGGELQVQGRVLVENLARLFDGYAPEPSLLHGDLWGGNHAVVDGEPVIFDPAVHYGDRECDLAMTRLFGGFGREFYAAYEEAWPLAPGHARRLPLYQLYHVLNHLNLFGRVYLSRAVALIHQLTPNPH